MKLKEFPLIQHAMYEIMMDQYMNGSYIKVEEDVPEWWEPKFKEAEAGLAKLEGKQLMDVLPDNFAEMLGYEELKECWGQSALDHFALPVNDLAPWLAHYAGMTVMQYFTAQEILEQFFDGCLRKTFMGVRK